MQIKFKTLALVFLGLSMLALGAQADEPTPRDNCRTEGLYREKRGEEVTRYRGHSLESGLDGCMKYVTGIVSWASQRYVPTTTRWDFSSAERQAYGSIRPGNGTRPLPLCELAEYLGNPKEARLVNTQRAKLGLEECVAQAEQLQTRVGRAGFVKFSSSSLSFVANGIVLSR